MNFGFDQEQQSLGETVQAVLQDLPGLTSPDLEIHQNDGAWQALAELGFFSLLVPERFGGAGLSLVDIALAVEALGLGLAPPLVASTLIATDLLVRHGTEAQQRTLLPEIAEGRTAIAIAEMEAGSGSDPAGFRTGATTGRLNGAKSLVAGAEQAKLILVVTASELLLLDANAPGLSVRPQGSIDPTAAVVQIAFDGVPLEPEARLGSAAPERAVARLQDVAATVYAGLSIGIAARMLATAVDYAKTRVQFGQPIGAFQAIKHRCADMTVAVEAGRSAAYYAFWAVSEDSPDRTRASAMAKSYCGDITRDVCNESIQIHGGMGFTWELGLHRFLRRAKLYEHSFGDTAFHNERVIAQTLAGMRGVESIARDAA